MVRVTARVRNAGRAAAPATVARLHDGDPSSSAPLGEVAVPPLAPGEETDVAFDYATADRAGTRTLYVVADAAGQVRESREDDNTASRSLTVEGLLADLEILPTDIVIVAGRAGGRRADAISVTVRNRGRARVGSLRPARERHRSSGASPRRRWPSRCPRSGRRPSCYPVEPGGRRGPRRSAAADARLRVPGVGRDERRARSGRCAAGRHARRAPIWRWRRECRRRLARGAAAGARGPRRRRERRPHGRQHDRGRVRRTAQEASARHAACRRRASGPPPRRGPRHGDDVRRAAARLVVDPDGELAEANEEDNPRSSASGTRGRWISRCRPPRFPRPRSRSAQTVTVTAEVRNRGTHGRLCDARPAAPTRPAGLAELARTTLSLPAGQSRAVVALVDGRRHPGTTCLSSCASIPSTCSRSGARTTTPCLCAPRPAFGPAEPRGERGGHRDRRPTRRSRARRRRCPRSSATRVQCPPDRPCVRFFVGDPDAEGTADR